MITPPITLHAAEGITIKKNINKSYKNKNEFGFCAELISFFLYFFNNVMISSYQIIKNKNLNLNYTLL